MKRFLIYKYDPENPSDEPKYVSYYIDLTKIPPMYLDALIYVKDNLDSTLSFRRSCREGICGSCAMNCDGLHSLACIREIDRDLSKPSLITPLGHMFVLKDLVVDMTNFYSQYKTIEPYLKRKEPKAEGVKFLFISAKIILSIHWRQSQTWWTLRMRPLCMLLNFMPILLVASWSLSWPISSHASLQMGYWLQRSILKRKTWKTLKGYQTWWMPKYRYVHSHLSKGIESTISHSVTS